MRNRKPFGWSALIFFLSGFSLYRFRRQLISRWLKLKPIRYRVEVRRALPIVMPDGITLRADHYSPKAKRLLPTILLRTPYGSSEAVGPNGLLSSFFAQRFAERGYNVLVQDVRGRFNSEGDFDPFVNETEDGRATLAWLENQAWFNGLLGMWGPSYLGYVQWAVAPDAPLTLKALVPITSGSRLATMSHRDNALGLDTLLRWISHLETMDRMPSYLGFIKLHKFGPRYQDRILKRGFDHLPLGEADEIIVGRQVPYFQRWLDPSLINEEHWKKLNIEDKLKQVTASVHFVGGWYDILLRETLSDYSSLLSARNVPYLTIGPWGHMDLECQWEGLRQGLAWFDATLKGDRHLVRAMPVSIYVMGEGVWRGLQSWPPPSVETSYYLHGRDSHVEGKGGVLSLNLPGEFEPPDNYTYNPHDPTPSVGGPLLDLRAGAVDNRELEARPDILIFSTPPLERDIEVIGIVKVILYIRSSLEHTDFFVRLCDVQLDGRSLNICDGFIRLEPGMDINQEDGIRRIEIELWPTANRFKRGHKLRLQISSGAHPRWNRNLGSGEPLISGVRMYSAQQTLFHNQKYPSVLLLPVTNA